MHKQQLLSSRISSFQPGTTLLELLIGVTIMLLLFGAVLGTLSQGFIAINMSRNKTHAQEANRIALEQTAALIRSSIDRQPSQEGNESAITINRRIETRESPQNITIQQEAGSSNLTTTGDLNKIIGYNINEINKIKFEVIDAGIDVEEELDGLYVWQDMNMNAKADPGEIKTVEEWGITKLWTKHDHYRSLYERDGKKFFTWDWWPSVIDIHEKDRNEMLKGRDLQKHQFINKNI